jgi:hypothetical protein
MKTVIFPMAGRATRFEGAFKPFLRLEDNRTFIEHAVEPFLAYKDKIDRLVFVYRQGEYPGPVGDISERLHLMFDDDFFVTTVELTEQTQGPAETVRFAVRKLGIVSPVIICDCDLSVDPGPLMEQKLTGQHSAMLLTWPLDGEHLKRWGVVALDGSRVVGIDEKRFPDTVGEYAGMIGCTLFAGGYLLAGGKHAYISDVVKDLVTKGAEVTAAQAPTARFFGDPEAAGWSRPWRGTIFIDLDGTIVPFKSNWDYEEEAFTLLPGVKDRVRAWQKAGYRVIVTTARPPDPRLAVRLLASGLDCGIMSGLPSGPRILVNDRDRNQTMVPHAVSFEVQRNEGLTGVQTNETTPTVLRRFPGGSGAETLLVHTGSMKCVYKRAPLHDVPLVARLKRQYQGMRRLREVLGGHTPLLFNDWEDGLDYYYGMEYLSGFRKLSESEDPASAALCAIRILDQSAYAYGKTLTGDEPEHIMREHVLTKVGPRLRDASTWLPMRRFVQSYWTTQDRETVYPINTSLAMGMEKFAPRRVACIHGDLTMENVLVHKGVDIRFIDVGDGPMFAPIELDLGKLYMSAAGGYESWSKKEIGAERFAERFVDFGPHTTMPDSVKTITAAYASILGLSRHDTFRRGCFYMGLHLIRAVPYRLKVSEGQALQALAQAAYWMSCSVSGGIVFDLTDK